MSNNTEPPVIFLAFADDVQRKLRNLPEEKRNIVDALKEAEQHGHCEVVVRTNCTSKELFEVFRDYANRVAIFHYAGHASGDALMLETAFGERATADAGGLAAFLALQQGLKLVFLNGCSTRDQSQGLLDAGVAVTVTTSQKINDETARRYATEFYTSLGKGSDIATAIAEAESIVRTNTAGNTRGFYLESDEDDADPVEFDELPWRHATRPGAELALRFNLPAAAKDHLFGVPPVPDHPLPQDDENLPFRHLSWFTNEHAAIFFGRGREIRQLYQWVTGSTAEPILLLYGQSGVGKSSLLHAGLMPRIESTHEVWYLRREQSLGLTGTLLQGFSSGDTSADTSDHDIRRLWHERENSSEKPLVIVLDQIEEVLTRPRPSEARELESFLSLLSPLFGRPANHPKGRLLLGFRQERHAEIEEEIARAGLPRGRMLLEPLGRDGIIEAIRGPADSPRLKSFGLTVENELPRTIADDLLASSGSAIANVLQILLTEMWKAAKDEDDNAPRFDAKLYGSRKKRGILLGDFLNEQLAVIGETVPEAGRSGLLLDILYRHTTSLGTATECQRKELNERYSHVSKALDGVIDACKANNLLTTPPTRQKRAANATRLVHDTVAPLVRERYERSELPGQRARRILDNRRIDWTEGRTGDPLDEADLKLVLSGKDGTRDLDDNERRLLKASQTEQALRETKRRWRRAIYIGSAAVIAIFAIVSYGLYRVAEMRANELTVALDIKERSDFNLRLARVHDVYRRDPVAANKDLDSCPKSKRDFAWGFYKQLCDRRLLTISHDLDDAVNCVRFSPDGRTIAVAGDDGRVVLQDSVTGRTICMVVDEPGVEMHVVRFSIDGSRLAVASGDGNLRICDLSQISETMSRLPDKDIRLIRAHDSRTKGADLQFDSTEPTLAYIFLAENHRNYTFWNIADGTALTPTEDERKQRIRRANCIGEEIDDRYVSPSGVWRVTESTLQISLIETDTENGSQKVIKTWPRESGETHAVTVSNDGKFVAWSIDSSIEIRSVDDDSEFLPLRVPAHQNSVLSLDFSEPIKDLALPLRIVSGSRDGTAIVWNVDNAWRVRARRDDDFTVASESSPDYQFSSRSHDGLRIAHVTFDGSIVVQSTSDDHPELSINSTEMIAVAWSIDDRTLASVPRDSENIMLWDPVNGDFRGELRGHREWVQTIEFKAASDGLPQRLVSVDDVDEVREWHAIGPASTTASAQ